MYQHPNDQFDALSDAIAQYLARASEVMKRVDGLLQAKAPIDAQQLH
jgi:hypothetical protein